MPEGPEVHRAAARVAAAVEGAIALRVEMGLERLVPWEPVLRGQRVASVVARGKAVLVTFESGHTVYAHGQLYGRWMVRRRGSMPDTNRQLRFALHTHEHSALLYSASDIEVVRRDELESIPYLARLGPDVLDPAVEEVLVRARLRDPRFRNRQLGQLYLDQGFLAGMGNYLRSEVLFLAAVHPRARPSELDATAIRTLAAESLEVPRRSFRTAGITVRDRLAERLKREGQARRRMRHYVFARAGQPCRVCGDTIEKDHIASRRIYRCPSCQSR